MDHKLPNVGQRLICQGCKATVRFAGEVHGSRGIWLGVEWDDPSRGKHSGTKDGIDYFQCSAPASGSFIRLTQAVSLGRTFLEALRSKYIDDFQTEGGKETIILGSSKGAIEVEAVGLKMVRAKLSHLERLREISLNSESVAFPDPPGNIRTSCPNVRSLDLSDNLLSSWESVALIASELPALRELTLDHNRFACLQNVQLLRDSFANVEELRLNQTLINWGEVLTLLPVMPRLRLLELGRNRIDKLAGTGEIHGLVETCIETLNFDENRLHDWEDIMTAVAKLPSLKRIILTSNGVPRIPPPSLDRNVQIGLEHVGLQENLISTWSDIDALGLWLPQLRTLSIVGNPIGSEQPLFHDFRSQVISRLPKLEALNGTLISSRERKDSELFFLSQASRDTSISPDERPSKYPRWNELCMQHGTPESAQPQSSGSSTLAGRLIDVIAYYAKAAQFSGAIECGISVRHLLADISPPVTVPVLPTMAMRAFRLKLLKALKALAGTACQGDLDVYLVMDGDKLTRLDMHHESRDLAWWGIQKGSEVVVIANDSHLQ